MMGRSKLAISDYSFFCFLAHHFRTNFWFKNSLGIASLPMQKKKSVWFVGASELATLLTYQLLLTVMLLGSWGWWKLYL